MAGIFIDKDSQSKLNSLITKTVKEEQKFEGDLDFLLDNIFKKKIKKKKTNIKPYNTTRIKSRNFFTNILYKGVTEE